MTLDGTPIVVVWFLVLTGAGWALAKGLLHRTRGCGDGHILPVLRLGIEPGGGVRRVQVGGRNILQPDLFAPGRGTAGDREEGIMALDQTTLLEYS
jgi:hypothetical protein